MVLGPVGIREGSNWTRYSRIPEKMERQPSRGNTSPVRGISDRYVEMA